MKDLFGRVNCVLHGEVQRRTCTTNLYPWSVMYCALINSGTTDVSGNKHTSKRGHAKRPRTSTWSTSRHCLCPRSARQQNSSAPNNKTSQSTRRLTSTAPPTSAPTASVSDSLHVPLHVGAPRNCSSDCGSQIGIGPMSKSVLPHIIKAYGAVEV